MLKQASYVGKSLEGYHITTELIANSLGRVCLGETDSSPKQYVTIKILDTQTLGPQQEASFLQEVHFFKTLRHPHILPIITAGVEQGSPYIIYDYAPGSVYKLMQSRPSCPLPVDETLTIVSQVGQALHFVHQQNVLHANLTPHTILIDARGQALLADFRMASLPVTIDPDDIDASIYIAPEQLSGAPSQASDQFALGAITYEMLTGRKPYLTSSAKDPQKYQRTTLLVPPTQLNAALSHHVEKALLQALDLDPTRRHPDIQAFIIALTTTDENKTEPFPKKSLTATPASEEPEEQIEPPIPARFTLPLVSIDEDDAPLLNPIPQQSIESDPWSPAHSVPEQTPRPSFEIPADSPIVQSATSHSFFPERSNTNRNRKQQKWIPIVLASVLVLASFGAAFFLLFPQQPEVRTQPTVTAQASITGNTGEGTTSVSKTPSPAASPTGKIREIPTAIVPTQASNASSTRPASTPTAKPDPTATPTPTTKPDPTATSTPEDDSAPSPTPEKKCYLLLICV